MSVGGGDNTYNHNQIDKATPVKNTIKKKKHNKILDNAKNGEE